MTGVYISHVQAKTGSGDAITEDPLRHGERRWRRRRRIRRERAGQDRSRRAGVDMKELGTENRKAEENPVKRGMLKNN